MKRFVMCISMGYLAAACAVDGGGSAERTARTATGAVEQGIVRGDDDLCSRWTACYLGCAAMPCDDDASCAEQQAAYSACDTANAPAPDYCPLPL